MSSGPQKLQTGVYPRLTSSVDLWQGFVDGDTSQHDGSTIVAHSTALREPVSANYRLNGAYFFNFTSPLASMVYGRFRFLASKEVKSAAVG